MLKSPLGEIHVNSNVQEISYKHDPLKNLDIGQRGHPIFDVDGRYKISVDISGLKVPFSIDCQFDVKGMYTDSGINSGQKLALKTWEKDELMFSIGTEDEIDGIETKYLDRGLRVCIAKNNVVNEVIFGIAWVYIKDYEKEHNYTWFAADPVYGREDFKSLATGNCPPQKHNKCNNM